MQPMTSCSITDTELQALAENSFNEEQETPLLVHLRTCKRCQLRLRKIFEKKALPSLEVKEEGQLKKLIQALVRNTEQKKQARQSGWRLIQALINPGLPVLAAADNQTADDKLTRLAAETASLFFVAICDKNHTGYWRAEFPLPVEASPETMFIVRVKNANGEPVQKGIFSFCGIEREVEYGRVRYTIKELRESLKKKMVSFRYPGGELIDGVLELFGEEE